MKIRYLTLCAGPHGVFQVGDIQEGDAQGLLPLVEGGYAEVVENDKLTLKKEVIETAEATPKKETAVKRNTSRKTANRKG